MNYVEMVKKIKSFLDSSGISAYDLIRIGKDLCACRTCRFYVPHYTVDGKEIDYGHCVKNNILKGKKPNQNACGFWEMREDGR